MNELFMTKSGRFRSTEAVARALIGCRLTRKVNGEVLSGVIVETEAYLGRSDKACHSFGGRRTPRVEAMYLPAGHLYVYFVYGMYYCLNFVTRGEDAPEAVLIRAVEPREGLARMRENRRGKALRDLASGPGKLCQAFEIDKSLNGISLDRGPVQIELPRRKLPRRKIGSCSRVGIGYAEEAVHWPLRFYLKGSPFLSNPRPDRVSSA